MRTGRTLFLLVAILIAGCGDKGGDEPPAGLSVASLPGVYSGVFPCAGCPCIPTTLWVRDDGRFFIEQEYPESEGREAMTAHNLGRWTWDAADRALVLQGAGPGRVFTRPEPDSLVMRAASDLEHRLTRDPSAPEFAAEIRMTGVMRVGADGASFRECLTGIVAPVSRRGEYSKFLHQYRSSRSRGAPAYVEFDGRFSWADGSKVQSLTIERFHTIRNDGRC